MLTNKNGHVMLMYMTNLHNMGKKSPYIFILLIMILTLSACAPSEDKILEAQSVYREMISVNNQVVAARNAISDTSLDTELNALAEKIPEIEEYNLNEMSDSEIDILIESMNTIIDAYTGFLNTIGEIKIAEDATRLTTIYFNLVNDTDLTFVKLLLEEEGDTDEISDALSSVSGFTPGQEMIGLAIHRDADNTPWILELSDESVNEASDEEGNEGEGVYRIELDVSSFNEENFTLYIRRDAESGEVYVSQD